MFDSIEDTEHARQRKPGFNVLLLALVALTYAFCYFVLGRKQLAGESASFVGGITIAASVNWRFKRYNWFWATLLALVCLHVAALIFLKLPPNWDGKELGILLIPSVLVSLRSFAIVKNSIKSRTRRQKEERA